MCFLTVSTVQQTVSGSAPPQHPPDTINWTLFRCSLRVKPCLANLVWRHSPALFSDSSSARERASRASEIVRIVPVEREVGSFADSDSFYLWPPDCFARSHFTSTSPQGIFLSSTFFFVSLDVLL